ncbi:MAG: hypothetical protein IPJ03_07465 [Ignavibacteriales bacterium]|nr:hypothetical protein [Ignavibacteriales bacterium]
MGKKRIFYPSQIGATLPYLQNFKDKLTAGLAAKYSSTPAFQTQLATWITDSTAAINKAVADFETFQQSTTLQNELLFTVKDGLLKEIRRIQDHSAFDEADAQALGFRVETPPVDYNTAKPVITGVTVLSDQVIIDWLRRQMDGVVILASYDGVTYTELARDLRSPFEDKRKNVVPGKPETRYYKLRYLKGDLPVGLESDVIRVVALID